MNGERKHKPARGRHVLPKLFCEHSGFPAHPTLSEASPAYDTALQTLTVSTHPFPETKGCQVEFLGEEMEEEGLEMGMECGLQSIKAKQEGWKRE